MKPALLYIFALMFLKACSTDPIPQQPGTIKTELPNDSIRFNQTEATVYPKAEVTDAYTNAITEYIRAGYNNRPAPDTLFIGKNVEFPDIKIPATINKSNIKLLTVEETDKKFKDGKAMVYLNVMGWMQTDKAEFLIVTFIEGGKPQHNCHLYFTCQTGKNKFMLDSLNFEYAYPK